MLRGVHTWSSGSSFSYWKGFGDVCVGACVCVRVCVCWGFHRRLPVRQTHPLHMQPHQHSINNESRCPMLQVKYEPVMSGCSGAAVLQPLSKRLFGVSGRLRVTARSVQQQLQIIYVLCSPFRIKLLMFHRPFGWFQSTLSAASAAVGYHNLGQSQKSILGPKATVCSWTPALDLPPTPNNNNTHTHIRA